MLKASAKVTPKAVFIICACVNVAEAWHLDFELFITAVTNGKHSQNSLHYSGKALDLRSKTFKNSEEKHEFVKAVLRRLGPNYQGFLEDEGKPNEHFHFEYDPKVH